MPRRLIGIGGSSLAIALFLTALPAFAVITRLTPLKEVLTEQEFICVLKVEKVDPKRPAANFKLSGDLKGKFPFKHLPVNLTGDDEAKKNDHSAILLKRLAPDLPLILFANQRGKRLTAFVFTNGTWFQMVGHVVEGKDEPVWQFTHGEPFLRRTFQGATEELRQIIVDSLAGKKAPPEPNEKEPPGFGPEATPRASSRLSGNRSALFAVIPTLGIGGPLAVLAILFPSLFGGVLVLFRRWLAFFTVLSTNLTIYCVYSWFGHYWASSWWATPLAQWTLMSSVVLLGALWAYRRQVRALDPGSDASVTPQRTENLILGLLSVACVATVAIGLVQPPPPFEPWWNLLEVVTAAVLAGALYKVSLAVRRRPADGPRRPLATEGVMLWTALAGCLAVFVLRPGQIAIASDRDAAGVGRTVAELRKERCWLFLFLPPGGQVVSAPLIDGQKAYVTVAHKKGLETFGALYCLDLESKKQLWSFDADGDMKQVISSPCLADGKVYFGEGFHDDKNCKVYCVDATSGKKIWEFPTTSQTESSPCVAGGKVFIGAGDDGVYALDALTGKRLWQYPPKPDAGRLLRIGANPLVVGQRLYVGSGVDRNRPSDPGETALLCLDVNTGKQLWKTPVDLPCWAGAAVAGDHVYFGLGNGDLYDDAVKPAGAMVCLEANTGRQVWRVDVPNGIFDRPALDRHRLYFGARDSVVYCVNRFDGQERWKKVLGTPVIASPVLEQGVGGGQPTSLFAITAKGVVSCLDPFTGKVHWSFDEPSRTDPHVCSTPTVVLTPTPEGDRRRLYFGVGLNGMNTPALYCVEDLLPDR